MHPAPAMSRALPRLLAALALALTASACTDDDDTGTAERPAEVTDPCVCVHADGTADEACLAETISELGDGICVQLRCEQADGSIVRTSVCAPPSGATSASS